MLNIDKIVFNITHMMNGYCLSVMGRADEGKEHLEGIFVHTKIDIIPYMEKGEVGKRIIFDGEPLSEAIAGQVEKIISAAKPEAPAILRDIIEEAVYKLSDEVFDIHATDTTNGQQTRTTDDLEAKLTQARLELSKKVLTTVKQLLTRRARNNRKTMEILGPIAEQAESSLETEAYKIAEGGPKGISWVPENKPYTYQIQPDQNFAEYMGSQGQLEQSIGKVSYKVSGNPGEHKKEPVFTSAASRHANEFAGILKLMLKLPEEYKGHDTSLIITNSIEAFSDEWETHIELFMDMLEAKAKELKA